MSKISIKRSHQLPHAKAVHAANRVASRLEAEHGIRSRWEGETLHFERAGVKGSLRVLPKKLQLDVELGFLVSMFHETIEEQIERTLDKELGSHK